MEPGWYKFGTQVGYARRTLSGRAMAIDYIDGSFTAMPKDHWYLSSAIPASRDDVESAKAALAKARGKTV